MMDLVRSFVSSSYHGEAKQVIVLKQGSGVKYSSGKIGDVHSSERVNSASIASNTVEVKMLKDHLQVIGSQVCDRVWIIDIASVPVVRDAFMAPSVREVAIFARNSVEGLQDIPVEDTLRVLLGLVPHESVDETPCSGVGCTGSVTMK